MQGNTSGNNNITSSSLFRRLFGEWTQVVTLATLRADAIAGLLGAVLVLP